MGERESEEEKEQRCGERGRQGGTNLSERQLVLGAIFINRWFLVPHHNVNVDLIQ